MRHRAGQSHAQGSAAASIHAARIHFWDRMLLLAAITKRGYSLVPQIGGGKWSGRAAGRAGVVVVALVFRARKCGDGVRWPGRAGAVVAASCSGAVFGPPLLSIECTPPLQSSVPKWPIETLGPKAAGV